MSNSSEVEVLMLVLEEQRETNRLLGALVEALAEEAEEPVQTTYMDGTPVRRKPETTEWVQRTGGTCL